MGFGHLGQEGPPERAEGGLALSRLAEDWGASGGSWRLRADHRAQAGSRGRALRAGQHCELQPLLSEGSGLSRLSSPCSTLRDGLPPVTVPRQVAAAQHRGSRRASGLGWPLPLPVFLPGPGLCMLQPGLGSSAPESRPLIFVPPSFQIPREEPVVAGLCLGHCHGPTDHGAGELQGGFVREEGHTCRHLLEDPQPSQPRAEQSLASSGMCCLSPIFLHTGAGEWAPITRVDVSLCPLLQVSGPQPENPLWTLTANWDTSARNSRDGK